jgi:hypothetical protein
MQWSVYTIPATTPSSRYVARSDIDGKRKRFG